MMGCLHRSLRESSRCDSSPAMLQLRSDVVFLLNLPPMHRSPGNTHAAAQPGSIWGGAVAALGGGRPAQQSPPHTPPPAAAQPENLEVLHPRQDWAVCLSLGAIMSRRASVAHAIL